ncbi:MAG: hypothetical protein KID00_14660 [Clostridium argentinense]|uniref:Uncharacterized protein n=1 Tax=Clostridium faecium TaxID=2762223 RepID=A0ABR8YRM5_9CLOT|nr:MULTISPECIES: hypothetical protein [Clostridium]MBD8046879.1 hypothetical protein [Clostridium faecium]MBS5825065.1 hypothetical protein [Clostridium argentinense]MDU1349844.1 hypothetical protein [Clostridium argentinense]
MKNNIFDLVVEAVAFAISLAAFVMLTIVKDANATSILKLLAFSLVASNFINIKKYSNKR